jgi:hypothetical protein
MAELCAERAERPAEGLAEGACAHPGWRKAAAHEARGVQSFATTSAPPATPIANIVEAPPSGGISVEFVVLAGRTAEMSEQDTKSAAPAGIVYDPQVIDRLVGTIGTSRTTSGKTAATITGHRDREWWRVEACRIGSDWRSILKTIAGAVRGWQILHDVDQQPSACLSCGADHLLCINPSGTIEAIMSAVRARGVSALKEPANIERLSRCDAAARKEINRRIESLIAAREIAA